MTLNQHKNRKLRHNQKFKSETMGKLINRIPGLRLLLSSLPGSALRTLVNHSASLGMSTSFLKALPGKLNIKNTHLVFTLPQKLRDERV